MIDKREKITVLIADDHRIFREGLRALLEEDQGIKVIGQAGSGEEAIQKAMELKPHIVIMDITMPPGMNGIQATRILREREPEIQVIILSMTGEEEYVTQALEADAAGFVVKQGAPTELTTAIHGVARGEAYFSPPIAKIIIEQRRRKEEKKESDLTLKDREIIQLVCQGKSNREIGDILQISPKTVDKYRQNILRKLNLHDSIALTRYALQHGLISEN
jgi:DNA-binding NarL/FixJ family response regulator